MVLRLLGICVAACVGVSIDRLASRDDHDLWIAYNVGNGVRYFNPDQSRSVSILPSGAKVTNHKVAMLQHDPSDRDELAWDGDCAPKCTWECKHTECEKECTPQCDVPNCQTRCKQVDMQRVMQECKVKCNDKPRCATFCPPQQPCNQYDEHGHRKCHKPDCATKCEKANCFIHCNETQEQGRRCRNVCAEPKCSWKCKNPKVCPKPTCRLQCTRPNCTFAHTSFQLPDLTPDMNVMTNFTAIHAEKFSVGPWSECDCNTGKQYREVTCKSKLNICGPGATPETSRACEVPCQGFYEFSAWSRCKGECFGSGYRQRQGTCKKGTCGGIPFKREIERCEFDSSRCHMCEAEVFGGPAWDDWSSKFEVGTYGERSLRERNIQNDQISSLSVKGFCCAVRLFQYGDFNHGFNQDRTWKALYHEGNYNKEDLESKGGFDNSGGSFEVFKDQECIEHAKRIADREHPGNHDGVAVTSLVVAFGAVVLAW